MMYRDTSIWQGKTFQKRLDELFTVELPEDIPGAHDIQGRIGGYWHGNEPCHHVAYLYNYLGQPWKCQYWIRKIASSFMVISRAH